MGEFIQKVINLISKVSCYKPVEIASNEDQVIIKIRKTKARMERLFAFSLLISIILISIGHWLAYGMLAIILIVFILYQLSEEVIILTSPHSSVVKNSYLLGKKLFTDYSFHLNYPLIINCVKYNKGTDGEAFNFCRFEFYIEYQRKYILFTSDNEEVLDELIKQLRPRTFYFKGEPIVIRYLGEVDEHAK